MRVDTSMAEATLPDSATSAKQETIKVRAIAAAVAGNALEFYDFIVYSFFAVYIGKTFFPLGSEAASLLASVAVFGAGFFTRPLGGVVIGAFADKAGRRAALILTVTLITVGTLGMAVTPGYETIGLAAPIIVVFCRLIQGLALGGEVGPASSLLIEAAPPNKRGLYGCWQFASQGIAAVAAGFMGVLVSWWLPADDLVKWGWRIPFFVSLALIPIAIYIRRELPETLEKPNEKSGSQIVKFLFTKQKKYMWLGILLMAAPTISTQVGNYMTTYAIQTLKLSPTIAQLATVTNGAMIFVGSLVAGVLADKYGRKVVIFIPRLLLMILVIPLFVWLTGSPSTQTLLIVTVLVTGLTAMSAAVVMISIPEMMPINVRASGVSIIYAIGATVFGGTTQFVITWFIQHYGAITPAYYVVVSSVVSLIALYFIPETKRTDVYK